MTFQLRLCLSLGMTLSQLRENMTTDEFTLWLAYNALHALPHARNEATAVIGSAAVCNALGAKVRPAELLPDYEPVHVVQGKEGWDVMTGWAKGINKRSNGKSSNR